MTRFLVLFISILFFVGCAQITALEGGEKDVTPPQVDSLHSSPLGATNFHPKLIKLTFDEWVQIKDVLKNVLVSPPLAKRPKVTLKRKTVTFELDKDEVLKENTTYSINFGAAIVDLTEGNAASGLTYVFSTGDEIDSLSVRGTVVDAFTGAPLENINVMLYDNLTDSVVYKDRPYYLAISDKAGQFQINNVRAGEFKAFALKDGDLDYKFSQVDEPIGFLSGPIMVGDSTPQLNFRVASELIPLKLKSKGAQLNGVKLLEFNREPRALTFQPIGVKSFEYQEKGDSVKIWYMGVDTNSAVVVLSEKEIIDTVSLRPKSRIKNLTDQLFIGNGEKMQNVTLLPHKSLAMEFNMPVAAWNDSLITLTPDSLSTNLAFSITGDTVNPNAISFDFPWVETSTYQLTIFPKGITGINGNELQDTLTRKIVITPKDQLGNIQLTIKPPDTTKQYVLQLMLSKQEIGSKILLPGQDKVTWSQLPPAAYTVTCIEDDNANEIWDSGNYLQTQQPERIFVKTLETLRANWDLEVSWNPLIKIPKEESPLDSKKEKKKI